MKVHYLYSKFSNWEDNFDRVFLYSDPHGVGAGLDEDAVNTHNLFQYASDEEQIENINKVCTKKDLIVFLGDMGDYRKFQEKLKCKNWILITGNHDKGLQNYQGDFIEVYDGPIFISSKILLSHEPLFNRFNCKNDILFNICGHIHNKEEIDKFKAEGYTNFICIAANIYGYKPLCLSDLLKRKGEFKDFTYLSNCQNIHRVTVDRATERKKNKQKFNIENDKI